MNYYNPSGLRQPSRLKKEIANSAAPRPDSISRLARPSWISLFFIVMLMAMNHSVWAQSSANYTFATNTTGSLALDMNGTAIDMSTGTTQLVGPGLDAAASAVTNIGFDFHFMGTRFTQFSVQEDGILQLGATAAPTNTYTISGGSATSPRLSALNADFRTGSTTGKIHYKVVGTAPNRVLVVEFFNMQLFYTSAAMAGTSTWQMRLYEKGNIEYAYGTVSAVDIGNGAANRSPSVGFYTGSASGAFASILYAGNTVSVNTPYAANPAVAALGAIANLSSSADGSRRVYQLIPPGNPGNALATVIPPPTFLSFSSVAGGSMTLNWAESSPNIDVLKYIILRSSDGGATYTLAGSVNVGTTTYNATGLTPSTSYSWRVYAISEGGLSTNLDGVQATNPPGTYTSVATGNWNSPTTWDAGSVPNSFDNAVISAGNTVTIDATGLSINNLSVQGTLAYATTPTNFTVNNNLTVANGGIINAFNGTTGKTLTVAGNIQNNGILDFSVGTTTAATLTLTGTAVQTVSGSGTFNTGVIRNLTFSNTNTATPNINWLINDVKIANNLNLTGARVNLGTNKMTFGAGAAGGTLTAPVGTGFLSGGKFSRWWTAAATGTSVTAGTDPTNATSRYPFINAAGANRAMYITRTNATGGVAGELAVVYNDAAGVTSGLSVADGAYTVNERYDGNWVVSNEGTPIASSSYTVVLLAQNAFSGLSNGNARVMFANAAIGGAHQNGTTTPGAQRITVSQTDLLSGPLYVGVSSSDIPFISVGNGNWTTPATWNKNAVPGATDTVTIANATNVTLDGTNTITSLTVATGGTLTAATGALNFTSLTNSGTVNISGANLSASGTVTNNSILNVTGGSLNVTGASTTGITNAAAGTITVGGGVINLSTAGANNRTFANNGIMTVTSGTVNVFGNMAHNGGSTFNQSGGNINIDGNDAGNAASSVASGTHLMNITATAVSNLSLTGGTITIVDPPQSSSTSTYALRVSQGGAFNSAGVNHTIKFGDGVSNDSSTTGSNGFYVYLFPGSFLYGLGNVVVDAGTIGTNRFVRTTSTVPIKNNLNIISGEYQLGSTTHLGGNLTNNGILTAGSTLNINDYNGAAVASTNPQTISGAGVFRNLATSPTANLTSLTVNNTNATGLTLDVPLSLSGTLTLTSGKVNTTNVNLLTMGTATASGTISGGSATAYVNGPLARTIISGNSNTTYQYFPVGKAAYAPVWLAPTTTAVSNFKAEAFDSNSGTADVSLINLSATRRWEIPLMSGTITDMNVRVGDASIVSTSIPVQGLTPAGVYSNAFGSVATYVAGTPNTTQSNTPISAANFTGYVSFADSNSCSGTPNPGNTIASSTSICAGASVALSLQNAVSGSGVSYQWKSSTNGTTYNDISGATGPTLTVVPTVSTYYQCVVTCSAGPATGTSAPVHIVFANEVATNTPNTRCGVGTVQLAATPSAGATINWYAAATGGLPVGTGNTFTTPSISATTTYYAAAEVSTPPVTSALGAGATTSSTVAQTFFPGSWGGTKTQYIIRASELTAAGFNGTTNLSSLGFEPTNSGQSYQGFTVHLAHTTATTAPTTTFISDGLTQVYAGTGTNGGITPVANTVNTLAFGTGAGSSSVFNWDGTSNVVVSISWSSVPSATTATSTSMKVDNVGFVASAYRQRDSATPAAMLAETSVNTTDSFRPRFTINGQSICSSPRVPVVATVTTAPAFTLSGNPASVCGGASTAAVTITAGAADYDTYVWTPSTGISGNAVTGWTFNPATTTTYTLAATNTVSGCAATATVAVTINTTPPAITVVPDLPTICQGSIQELTVSGNTVTRPIVSGAGTDTSGTNATGATLGPNPLQAYYGGTKQQWIYTAAELTALGFEANAQISAIKLNLVTANPANVLNNVVVKMKNSPTASFATTTSWESGMVIVKAAASHTPSVGVNNFVLDTPFAWNGTDNLIIEMNYSNNNGGSTVGYNTAKHSPTTFVSTIYYRVDTQTAATVDAYVGAASYTYSARTDVTFDVLPKVTWSSTGSGDLFSDAAGTIPYVSGNGAAKVYAKPVGNTTYSATVAIGTCSSTDSTLITVTPSTTPNFAEIGTICQGSTAPTLATTSPNGVTGTWAPAVVSNSANGTYVFTPATGQCATTQTLNVVVTPATVPNFAEIGSICQGSTAPTLATTSPNGVTGTWAPAVVSNTANGTYVFTPTTGQCATTQTLNVTVTTTPAPTGTSPQDFPAGATLASFTVNGTGIIWYTASSLGTVLPASTPIVAGTTYYASQTVGGCESVLRLPVQAGTMLKVDGFDNANFKYYPNPVNNILTVSYTEAITGLKLYNMVGQQLITKSVNSNETQIDMSHLPAGSYLLEVSVGSKSKMVKLIKNQ
ncbi:putative secreted protein (Por secretion system target) [Flavobacterium endophyticum]|uniref:Putative secreted protein (Por secretion system target) n=2 Tax=Flavobacterium endophyticum TaxID=1540163 RepID=A0A495MJX7_9FLAO|nr:putative secreted protein (Por secretion system target) [Flavobacterium endophyticum]